MRTRSLLLGSAVLVVTGALLAPAGASGSSRPFVMRDVRASVADIPLGHVHYPVDGDHAQPDTQIEPSIAVNPANPANAVAVFQEDRIDSGGDAGNGFATTFDHGKHWIHGYLPGLTPKTGGTFERASDAVVAWGADPAQKGHYLVYANSLVFDQDTHNGMPSGMAVNVSKNGGRTWSKAVILEQDGLGGLNDKNWIVADNGTGVGHTTGRVYVVWDRVAPMVYTYCDKGCDKLSNWANASTKNDTFYTFGATAGIGSYPLVLPNGDLGIVYQTDAAGTPPIKVTDQPDFAPNELQYAVAAGAGSVVWPAPLPFPQEGFGISANKSTCCAQQRAGTLPSAAVDQKTGRIYVAWEDSRHRSDGLNDILVSSSTNGVVWSSPVKVNKDRGDSHVNHWDAMIDVGPDSTVHVAYRQRLEKDGLSPFVDTYYQRSTDAGLKWSTPLRVNIHERADVRYAAFSRGGAFLGDYNQIAAASDGTAYVVHHESLPRYKGERCNCSFGSGNGHQHQYTYVGVIGPALPRKSGHSAGGLGSPTMAPLRTGGAVPEVLGAGAVLLALGLALRRRPRRFALSAP
jgi:hypothetical protein